MGRVKYEENLGDDIMRVSANPIPYSKINVTAKSGLCWLQTFYASNLLSDKIANGRSLRVNPSEKLVRNPASRECMICSSPIRGPRGFRGFQHRPHL